jgi:Raf kinase inhibitor-like YbhB/YbcL family protein
LPEGVPKQKKLPDGSLQGINDFRMFGYDGPAPPQGTHRYVFKVFALDIFLNLEAGAAKKDVLAAMTGHILAEGRLEGRYKKEIDRLSKPVI